MLLSCENTLKNICNELQNVKCLFFLKKNSFGIFWESSTIHILTVCNKKIDKESPGCVLQQNVHNRNIFLLRFLFYSSYSILSKKNLNSRNFYYSLSFHKLLLGVTIDIMITSNEQSSTFLLDCLYSTITKCVG